MTTAAFCLVSAGSFSGYSVAIERSLDLGPRWSHFTSKRFSAVFALFRRPKDSAVSDR